MALELGLQHCGYVGVCQFCKETFTTDDQTATEARKTLRKYGWKFVRDKGWKCDLCVGEEPKRLKKGVKS